jgi:hypothetical protein
MASRLASARNILQRLHSTRGERKSEPQIRLTWTELTQRHGQILRVLICLPDPQQLPIVGPLSQQGMLERLRLGTMYLRLGSRSRRGPSRRSSTRWTRFHKSPEKRRALRLGLPYIVRAQVTWRPARNAFEDPSQLDTLRKSPDPRHTEKEAKHAGLSSSGAVKIALISRRRLGRQRQRMATAQRPEALKPHLPGSDRSNRSSDSTQARIA